MRTRGPVRASRPAAWPAIGLRCRWQRPGAGPVPLRFLSGRVGGWYGLPLQRAGECLGDEDAEDEAADVREERHSAAVGGRRQQAEVRLDELVEEPGSEE